VIPDCCAEIILSRVPRIGGADWPSKPAYKAYQFKAISAKIIRPEGIFPQLYLRTYPMTKIENPEVIAIIAAEGAAQNAAIRNERHSRVIRKIYFDIEIETQGLNIHDEETDEFEIIDIPTDWGSEIIETLPRLRVLIDYPLTNAYSLDLTHEDGAGWTMRQFAIAICEAYEAIYSEEGEDPGHVEGMLNRAKSDGKYGIWGHDLGDLTLSSATRFEDGTWRIGVSS
jgi:hypothetical protein